MTREDIIRWAREAGFEADEPVNDVLINDGYWADQLERFAALVSAAEREACAKVCEEKSMVKGGEVFAAKIRARG